MDKTILQYQISSWDQLKDCKSNLSPDYSIKVSKFINNYDVNGTRICVYHSKYGVLFSYLICPHGDLISNYIYETSLDIMTPDIVINELSRFGFYIDFVPENDLPSGQVELLRSIKSLGYDKIRVLAVNDLSNDSTKIYIAAFKIGKLDDWYNAGYSPSRIEFENAVISGYAFVVSDDQYDWNFLYNSVQDIDQILSRYDQNDTE